MGISPTQLVIILVIVALIFGTKKLRGIGGDLGGAVKSFKKAMNDEDKSNKPEDAAAIEPRAEIADTIVTSQKETA